MNIDAVQQALDSYGLKLRGITQLNAEEIHDYGFIGLRSIALVGNIGSSFWPVFSRSSEYGDGEPDPLDRWSQRIASEISPGLNAIPVYPFQGPPYLPFQQWAQRAEALHQSPIGLMMHPHYGLWHSYRFGLLFAEAIDYAELSVESPCISCVEQPCLNTCPVNAFSADGYDVGGCAEYLKQTPEADCFQHGCMARFECPVGRDYRYVDAQSQFHLGAFIGARTA